MKTAHNQPATQAAPRIVKHAGSREPLYLGDFTDYDEALAAGEQWRQVFPNLAVDGESSR